MPRHPAAPLFFAALVSGAGLCAGAEEPAREAEDNALKAAGIETSLTYTADGDTNLSGGIQKGTTYKGLADLAITADLEKALHFKNWTAHADLFHIHGDNLSERFTGDIGGVNCIEAVNTFRLYEAWVEWKSGPWSVRAGQVTIDCEFDGLASAGVFRNGAFGPSAGVLFNVPAPGYPIATTGVRVRHELTPALYAQVEVTDGNPAPGALGDPSPEGPKHAYLNSSGLGLRWDSSEGVLVIAEIGNVPDEAHTTHWCGGLFYHTDTFSDLTRDNTGGRLAAADSSGIPQGDSGNYGIYAGIEHPFQWVNGKPLSLFANATLLPSDRNALPFVWQVGATWAGIIPERPDDTLALGMAGMEAGDGWKQWVRETNATNDLHLPVPDGEWVVELTWRAAVTKRWTLQPDVQWLRHPGASSEIHDAFVVGLRSVYTF